MPGQVQKRLSEYSDVELGEMVRTSQLYADSVAAGVRAAERARVMAQVRQIQGELRRREVERVSFAGLGLKAVANG